MYYNEIKLIGGEKRREVIAALCRSQAFQWREPARPCVPAPDGTQTGDMSGVPQAMANVKEEVVGKNFWLLSCAP